MPPSYVLRVHDSVIVMSVSNQKEKEAKNSWPLRGRKDTAVSGPSASLPIPKQNQAWTAGRKKGMSCILRCLGWLPGYSQQGSCLPKRELIP